MDFLTPHVQRVTVAVLLCPVMAGVCGAAEAVQDSAALLTARGKIAMVDRLNQLVTVDQGPGARVRSKQPALRVLELRVNDETVISKADTRLHLRDIRPSEERVAIQYVPQGSQLVARAITFERPAGLTRTTGTLESVDPVKGELALQPDRLDSKEAPQRFVVNERTVMMQGGERSDIANMQPGDGVSIEYVTEEKRPVIYTMTVTTPHRHSVFDLGRPWPETPGLVSGPSGSTPSDARP